MIKRLKDAQVDYKDAIAAMKEKGSPCSSEHDQEIEAQNKWYRALQNENPWSRYNAPGLFNQLEKAYKKKVAFNKLDADAKLNDPLEEKDVDNALKEAAQNFAAAVGWNQAHKNGKCTKGDLKTSVSKCACTIAEILLKRGNVGPAVFVKKMIKASGTGLVKEKKREWNIKTQMRCSIMIVRLMIVRIVQEKTLQKIVLKITFGLSLITMRKPKRWKIISS